MKKQVTKKSIRERGARIICIGYCNACYLLRDLDPFAYSARAEGWACDYYYVGNNVIIATGYDCDRLGGKYADAAKVREYNERARRIEGFSAEAKQSRAELLEEFIANI